MSGEKPSEKQLRQFQRYAEQRWIRDTMWCEWCVETQCRLERSEDGKLIWKCPACGEQLGIQRGACFEELGLKLKQIDQLARSFFLGTAVEQSARQLGVDPGLVRIFYDTMLERLGQMHGKAQMGSRVFAFFYTVEIPDSVSQEKRSPPFFLAVLTCLEEKKFSARLIPFGDPTALVDFVKEMALPGAKLLFGELCGEGAQPDPRTENVHEARRQVRQLDKYAVVSADLGQQQIWGVWRAGWKLAEDFKRFLTECYPVTQASCEEGLAKCWGVRFFNGAEECTNAVLHVSKQKRLPSINLDDPARLWGLFCPLDPLFDPQQARELWDRAQKSGSEMSAISQSEERHEKEIKRWPWKQEYAEFIDRAVRSSGRPLTCLEDLVNAFRKAFPNTQLSRHTIIKKAKQMGVTRRNNKLIFRAVLIPQDHEHV